MVHLIMLGGAAAGASHAVVKAPGHKDTATFDNRMGGTGSGPT